MSWARLGAKATGVDFSDAAIDLARSLNDELELNTRFIRSDVYDLPDVLDEEFDIVFTSYGVLVWLPDLDRWASTIQRLLRPGGTFYIVEFHPFVDAVEVFGVGRSARGRTATSTRKCQSRETNQATQERNRSRAPRMNGSTPSAT